ncbi:NAD-dependent epimerase/dehydratase family protein, partial [Nostoc sp. NIES-2111]
IRDHGALREVLAAARPEIVIHLAAQAIVSRAHAAPAETVSVNVGGTATLLETLARQAGWLAALVVTSDKVYRNTGTGQPFREDDPLGGGDPYSASKAACELAVASFVATYGMLGAVATARAGNVAGGGDFGEDRLLPDLLRASLTGEPVRLRRPLATRPFQHVLDVLTGYLLHAEDLCRKPRATPAALNFGPEGQPLRVEEVVAAYGAAAGHPVLWLPAEQEMLPEAQKLALDSG